MDISVTRAQNNPKEFFEDLKKLISIYENEVKPNIFSIELLWRELVGILKCNEEAKINNIRVKDLLTNLKNE